MTKKLLIALGVSMMSALPMTQASPMTTDNVFSNLIPMEENVEVDRNFTYLSSKDSKKLSSVTKPDGEHDPKDAPKDKKDKDKKNPPPKPSKKEGTKVDGNDNPPPPHLDENDSNKPGSEPNEKLQTKVDSSVVKKAKEKVKEKKEKKSDELKEKAKKKFSKKLK